MAKQARDEANYSLEDVPSSCPECGQRIDKNRPDQISHHQRPEHMPYAGSMKARKRRWQASP